MTAREDRLNNIAQMAVKKVLQSLGSSTFAEEHPKAVGHLAHLTIDMAADVASWIEVALVEMPALTFGMLNEELELDENLGSLNEVLNNNERELDELLDTGSVSLTMLGRRFEVSLLVREVPNG